MGLDTNITSWYQKAKDWRIRRPIQKPGQGEKEKGTKDSESVNIYPERPSTKD